MATTQKGAAKVRRRRVIAIISVLALILMGVAFIGVREAQESAWQTMCRGRLGKLQLALINYHEVYGSLPPAYIADADGTPMHSWRVLILPFLDARGEYASYRFDEPWDSLHNRTIAESPVKEHFRCPSRRWKPDAPTTDYVVVMGEGTAFPGAAPIKLEEIKDGLPETILVTEIVNSRIHWMEPRDLDFRTMSFEVNDGRRPSVSGPHLEGPGVVFGDRITAYRLKKTLRPETLKGLLTIAGGEPLEMGERVTGAPAYQVGD
ncbi:MAG TPA: DUF1559 domain-containing protein [Caulifigura sp.]|jgi:hypothetical protein|nr:DUF1559 domain-containing protein [Caulifigura sp.]